MQQKPILRSDYDLIEHDPIRNSINLKRMIAERVAQYIERKNTLKFTATPPEVPKGLQKTEIELRKH